MKVASQEPDFKFGETNKSEAFLKKFPLGKVGKNIVDAVNYVAKMYDVASCQKRLS